LPAWKFSDQVRSLLDQFSDLTKRSFQMSIAAVNVEKSRGVAVTGNESGQSENIATAPVFSSANVDTKGISHIQIGIK
jgi:hypothetical protein